MNKYNYSNGFEMDPVPFDSSAADRIKELMSVYNITQVEFAKHVGISQKQLSFILNRKAYMSVQVARQIEQATGLNARLLLELDLAYQLENTKMKTEKKIIPFEWLNSNKTPIST